MKLPNAERAIVEDEKIRDYLLSLEHPVGRSKARFFISLGFARHRWQELQQALLDLAQNEEAELGPATKFGQKYVVRGMIQGPTGRTAMVRSAWIILQGEDAPRFVTAYPGVRG
jgi:hypothetical protein